jgi:hypothetical protein
MTPVIPSSRSATDATRRVERVHVAGTAPHRMRADAPAARVGEGMRREHVRMELLVARARAARQEP